MPALNGQGGLDVHHPLSSSELKPGFLLVDLSRGSSSTLRPDLPIEFLVDGSLAMCLLHKGGLVLDVDDSGLRVQLSGTSRITAGLKHLQYILYALVLQIKLAHMVGTSAASCREGQTGPAVT